MALCKTMKTSVDVTMRLLEKIIFLTFCPSYLVLRRLNQRKLSKLHLYTLPPAVSEFAISTSLDVSPAAGDISPDSVCSCFYTSMLLVKDEKGNFGRK